MSRPFRLVPLCLKRRVGLPGDAGYAVRLLAPRGAATQPPLRCARIQRDEVLSINIERVLQTNRQVYGADKVCASCAVRGPTSLAARWSPRFARPGCAVLRAARSSVRRLPMRRHNATRPRQPRVHRAAAERAKGQRFHVRLYLAEFRVRGISH